MWQQWLRRCLLGLVLVLSSSLVYVLLTRTDTKSSPSPLSAADLTEGDAGIEHVTFRQSRDGNVQWEVRAERAELFEAERSAQLDTVDVTLYGANGPQLTLHGETGKIDTETRDFELANTSEPLEVQLEGGYTVYTRRLAWTEATGELHTQDAVTIVGNGMVVDGLGLVGKLDAEEFEVQQDVRVRLAQ